MIYTWFYIFNSDDFLNTGLPSRTYDVILDGIGPASILATRGERTGITYNGVFMALDLNDFNPRKMDDYAAYIDDSQNVWLGFKVAN